MKSDKILTKTISSGIQASVISATADANLNNTLWAVNWFDLRRSWMYALYNKLAYSHVKKNGGLPVFKGSLTQSILDNERLRRDMLLIVSYPQAASFLQMISYKVFQIKGWLRSSAVRHFQFGFMHRLYPSRNDEAVAGAYKGNLKYLVHVCEGADIKDFSPLVALAETFDIYPHFIGSKSAIFGLQKKQSGLKTLDFMLSHTLVFSGFDRDTLEDFVATDFYQDFFSGSKQNYTGLYHRII